MSISSANADSEEGGLNILSVLWRRRWTIVACVVIALGTAAEYLHKATPIYSSSSTIYVQQAVPKIIGDELSSSNQSGQYLFTQCQLIQSTAILSAALDLPGVSQAKCLAGIDNPVAFLKNAITAQPTKQGDLISVSMESIYPQDAAILVNAVVEAYIDYQGKQHKSTAVEVMHILQKEMDQHEGELKKTQQEMLTLKKAFPELTLQTEKGSVTMTHFAALSDLLSQAELRASDLNIALVEAKKCDGDDAKLRRLITQFQLASDFPSANDPQLTSAYRQQQQYVQSLQDQYGENNKTLINAERQAGRLEYQVKAAAQLDAEMCLVTLQDAAKFADARVAQLQKELDKERLATQATNTKQVEYEQLAQEAQRIEHALDTIDSRMKVIDVSEDVGALTVAVLETARPNMSPVRPRRPETLGIALIAGLMIGMGGALLRDMMDQRIRSAEEIVAALDLPIFGGVPHILGKGLPSERGQEISLRPRSDVAESYRTIRTAIYFGLADTGNAKTIVVTSPAPGDGKSTSISNLAIAIAQAGRRVLIMDADTRRPVQHKIFKLKDDIGLSNVLIGEKTLDETIQHTEFDKLDVLPCGPLPHNPAELLDSQKFLDVLKEVGLRYDQILVDSPPVVPVTDARILAASCDATILVLRVERSTRRMAEHAREALLSVGANLTGAIVNDVPRGKQGYGYYYYYRYGRYGYTYGNSKSDEKNGNGNGDGNGNGHKQLPAASTANAGTSID